MNFYDDVFTDVFKIDIYSWQNCLILSGQAVATRFSIGSARLIALHKTVWVNHILGSSDRLVRVKTVLVLVRIMQPHTRFIREAGTRENRACTGSDHATTY